ncbi:unnamed protein product [Cuscuta europaea]|uniref:Uncharacterized protein n=1 Tax=Cuscuta europaea TaxID=41803 RepID=A0A9P1EIT4_CUSEU|nr:unnamed protein product [Cuscuta europaea]
MSILNSSSPILLQIDKSLLPCSIFLASIIPLTFFKPPSSKGKSKAVAIEPPPPTALFLLSVSSLRNPAKHDQIEFSNKKASRRAVIVALLGWGSSSDAEL